LILCHFKIFVKLVISAANFLYMSINILLAMKLFTIVNFAQFKN
jgi:hypothetical protein